MRRTFGALVGAVAVGAAVGVILARRRATDGSGGQVRGAPMRPLRRFVVHRFDPMVVRFGLAGGARSPWGLIEHVGRVSGHVYYTPIAPRPIVDGFEFPLPYGTDVHWVRNIRAAGQARLQYHDTIVELEGPQIVEARAAASLPGSIRDLAQRMGYHYLRLHTVASKSGAFAHGDGHHAELTHGDAFAMPAEGPFGNPV